MYRQFDPVVGDDAVTKRLLDRHRKAGRGREPYSRFVQELEAAPAYRAQQLVGGGGGGDQNAPVDAPPGFWNNYEGMTDADFQDFNATQAARAVSMGRDYGKVPLSAQDPPPQVGDRMARKAKRVEERSDVSGGQALADALADPAGGDVSNVVGSMLEAKEDESDTKRPRSALPYAIDGFARARQQELVPNVAPRAGPSRDDIARERQQFRNVLAVEDEVVQAGFRGPIPASQQRGVDDLDEAHARHQL